MVGNEKVESSLEQDIKMLDISNDNLKKILLQSLPVQYEEDFLMFLKKTCNICFEQLSNGYIVFYYDIEYDTDVCMAIDNYNEEYEELISSKMQYVVMECIILSLWKTWKLKLI